MSSSTFPNSGIQFFVPGQYRGGGLYSNVSTDDKDIWDGDLNTTRDVSDTTGDKVWLFTTPQIIKWLYIHGHSGGSTTPSSLMYRVKFDDIYKSLTALYAESGSEFERPSSLYFRRLVGTTDRNVAISISSTAEVSKCTYFISTLYWTSHPTARWIIFSCDYALPMFNQSYEVRCTFPSSSVRTNLGIWTPDFALASQSQMLSHWTLKWSGLTAAQRDIFIDFLNAFGGNIQQPFAMMITHGDGTNDFYALLIEQGTVTITADKTGNYSAGFTATILQKDY